MQVEHEHIKLSQLDTNAVLASSPIWLKSECPAISSPPPPAAVLPVDRLVNTQSTIAFLQEQHATVLKGLHQQVEELQQRCKELQFCLTMQIPYVSSEERMRITMLERELFEKEQECNGLKEELFKSECKIEKLKKELHAKDQLERQLRREFEKRRRNEIIDGVSQHWEKRDTTPKPKGTSKEVSPLEKQRSLSSVSEHPQPIPPPKDGRTKVCARPAAFYRRILGLGPFLASNDNGPPINSPPLPQVNTNSDRLSASSVPQLPRITGSPTQSPLRQRPLVRQQLRLSRFGSSESQTLSIDHNPLSGPHLRPSETNYQNN